jgi:MFS family permease
VIAPHVRRLAPDPTQTATGVGMLQGAMWAAALVGAPWWGGRTDRRRVDETLALALWGCSVAAVVQAAAPRVSWLSAGRILQGFCFAAVAPSVLVGASRQAGPERQGTVIGTGAAFLVGGQVLGAVGGGLLSSIVSTSWTIAAMAVLFAAGAVLARGGRRVGAGTACP